MCRICEEWVRSELLEEHTQYCVIVEKYDVESDPTDVRITKMVHGLEERKEMFDKVYRTLKASVSIRLTLGVAVTGMYFQRCIIVYLPGWPSMCRCFVMQERKRKHLEPDKAEIVKSLNYARRMVTAGLAAAELQYEGLVSVDRYVASQCDASLKEFKKDLASDVCSYTMCLPCRMVSITDTAQTLARNLAEEQKNGVNIELGIFFKRLTSLVWLATIAIISLSRRR